MMFGLIKRLSIAAAAVVLLSQPLMASAFGPSYDHRPAIGQILSANASGSGTLVKQNYVLTAPHVLEEYLPKKNEIKGTDPIIIDLKDKGVVWQYQPATGKKLIDIPVLSMVVDPAYIRNQNGGYEEFEVNDVAFLKLDPKRMPVGIPTIPLIDQVKQLPLMCCVYGYGAHTGKEAVRPTADPRYAHRRDVPVGKDYIIHKTEEINSVPEKGVLKLDFQFNLPIGQNLQTAEAEIKHLVPDPNIDVRRIYTNHLLETIPGDSGGPLFITTPQGVRTIGVVSTCDESRYNGFASLITGSRKTGYRLNSMTARLFTAIQGIAGGEQEAFNAKNYLKKYIHVRAEALKANVNPEEYAQQHYIKYKPFFPDLSDKDEPFNAARYLQKYPHVRAEAQKAKVNPEVYAQQHYVKYKPFFPELSDK